MSGASGTGGHLDIGGVFERTGEIYQKAFGTVWIVALVLLIPAAIIQGILGDGWLGGTIGRIVQIVAGAWLMGSVVRVVQDVESSGEIDYTLGEFLGSVWPRILAIIVLEIIVGILIGIGLILLIIPGIIVALVLAVSLPALVVENRGIFDSMSRSAELTRNNRMRILAVGILAILIVWGVIALTVLVSLASWWIGALVGLILGILLYPYLSMLATVLYFRLVELKEGGVAVVEETVVIEEDAGPPPAV
jgi:hypothetical protein